MENPVTDFFQLNESSVLALGSTNNKPPYVSFIKINGKPILPPLIDEERRKELQKFKQKAIEIELKLTKEKKASSKLNQISSEVSSIVNVLPHCQSTPARPSTLDLAKKEVEKISSLSKLNTKCSPSNYSYVTGIEGAIFSSQNSVQKLDTAFRSTLEQRLASENELNMFQQSPMTEEHVLYNLTESNLNSIKKKKSWSPLKIDSINSLKVELPTKDNQETDDNLEVSLDESQNTPDTITHSPNLMRQNSYTLLTPSPALLQFLESQKDQKTSQRSQSGRKTWDLTKAKKNWNPENDILGKSSDEEGCNKECNIQFLNKKYSSSLDSISAAQNYHTNESDCCECSMPNSLAYDSGTSPESYNSKKNAPKIVKIKSRLKGKKVRSTKSVPSSDTVDQVPFKDYLKSVQGSSYNFTNEGISNELSDLSNTLLKMKVDFERQKRELEEKQQSEMKRLEVIFQKKEAELLSKVSHLPRKVTKSIYTQNSWPQNKTIADPRVMGDGNSSCIDRKENSRSEHLSRGRSHSVKDFPMLSSCENDFSRRARSMDFNQGNQDTDLDVSFQDDFLQCKVQPPSTTSETREMASNNEYIIESDSVSYFSSPSSTISSDNRHDLAHVCNLKKFQGISSEEYAKYNQAALKITAAARGFLTRRLLRTAHVQGLITTLRDAINCATQLHSASDIADSDIDLMRRLSRQIEAAWDAVYGVFFNTETSAKLQLIAADRERLKAATTKSSLPVIKKKRISSATKKSLDRKKGVMSKSQTSNGFSRVRMCTKMAASYPSSYFPQKFK